MKIIFCKGVELILCGWKYLYRILNGVGVELASEQHVPLCKDSTAAAWLTKHYPDRNGYFTR